MAPAAHAETFYADGTPDADGRRVGVLLSHGFTGSPASMVPWGKYLAEQGFAVSVPLLPGHGTTWQDMVPTRYDDYYAAIEREFEALKARTDLVVVGGLSMGGCLTLNLTERRAGEVAGLVMVNPAVASTNKQLLLLPVMKHLTKAFPAIGGDIKKEGVAENAYPKTPLKPLASMLAAWREVRTDLAKVDVPVLLFRSAEDHVVDPSSAKIILDGISSTDKTEVVLANSYHVATLDHDAQQIFEESAAFVRRVTSGAAGA